jgi:hypothetical protein
MTSLFSGPKTTTLPPPTVQEVKVPVVDQTQVDRNSADLIRRRRGTAATIGSGSDGSTAGSVNSVAAKALLGS